LIRLRWAALASILGIFVVLAGCGSNNQPFNDTPTIANLFPSSAAAAGPAFTMNIAGNGYISTSTAYWNNVQLTTTFNSTTLQLSAAVPASDIASPGVAQVVVVTPAPGGGMSNAATFTINAAPNAAPTISSLSPSSTALGVLPASGTLLVNGTNFIPSSIVAFNGNSRATTFVSSVQLSAAVSPLDVASNTTIGVTVSNPAPGGGTSNAVSFKVGTGSAVRLKSSVMSSGVQFPQVVSMSAMGGTSNGQSGLSANSADGRYVAFYSRATNLVMQGASGNIFVRDTCLGAVDCVSATFAIDLAPDGSAPNAAAETQVAISGDGRYVAFASHATNLTSGDAVAGDSGANIYVRDLCIGVSAPAGCSPGTQVASVGIDAPAAAIGGSFPSLTADGRFVAFVSSAGTSVSGSASVGSGVFVRDTCAGSSAGSACIAKTSSVTASESSLRGDSFATPVISQDGRYVFFVVRSGSAQGVSQVLLADMCLGIDAVASCKSSVSKVSVTADGTDLAGMNQAPSISADGRFVAFESQISGGTPNVFLRDACLGVSATTNCVPATLRLVEGAGAPSISPSGRYVSYVVPVAATSAAQEKNVGLLYVYDTCFTAIACSSQSYAVNGSSVISNQPPFVVNASTSAPLSSDGSFIAFSTVGAIAGLPLSGQGDVLLSITPF
jgi:Tol biopolymer transport system component